LNNFDKDLFEKDLFERNARQTLKLFVINAIQRKIMGNKMTFMGNKMTFMGNKMTFMGNIVTGCVCGVIIFPIKSIIICKHLQLMLFK